MFKNNFFKLFVLSCICFMSAVCSYGQGGGIIDVVTQKSAEVYKLSIDVRSENQVRATLIASDGTIFLEKQVSNGVVIDNLPLGTYRLITEDQTGQSQSYFLRLED